MGKYSCVKGCGYYEEVNFENVAICDGLKGVECRVVDSGCENYK